MLKILLEFSYRKCYITSRKGILLNMVWNVPKAGQGVKAEWHTWEERFRTLFFSDTCYVEVLPHHPRRFGEETTEQSGASGFLEKAVDIL